MSTKALKKRHGELAQAMTEFVIMLVAFLGVTIILVLLLAVFSEYGRRLISLVAWEPFM